MPDVAIEKPITLDLLETKAPALSATSDMPVIETKPDSSPESKPAPKEEKPDAKAEDPAAPEKAKDIEAEPADDLEQPESTSASDKPKPAKGVQKRLDELTRQAREAERREQAEREEKQRLLALLEAKEKPKPVSDAEKPKREDFEDDATYTDALVTHAADKAAARVRAEYEAKQKADQEKQEQASIAEENRKVHEAYAARKEKLMEKHPDYSEVAESPNVSISQAMALAIAHSEHGPDIAYYLGSNPDEAKRIASLVPTSQLMELGKLEGKLTAPSAKPVSAAPPPPKPHKPGTDAPVLSPEEESMEQYAARRKKEMAAQGRPGVRH